MIKAPKNISLIKEEIKNFYDKEVRVHVNLGRNKTAYSYTEVLCGNVQISGKATQTV